MPLGRVGRLEEGPRAVWVPAADWALLPHSEEGVDSILRGPLAPPLTPGPPLRACLEPIRSDPQNTHKVGGVAPTV